jgi:hypothetical protein
MASRANQEGVLHRARSGGAPPELAVAGVPPIPTMMLLRACFAAFVTSSVTMNPSGIAVAVAISIVVPSTEMAWSSPASSNSRPEGPRTDVEGTDRILGFSDYRGDEPTMHPAKRRHTTSRDRQLLGRFWSGTLTLQCQESRSTGDHLGINNSSPSVLWPCRRTAFARCDAGSECEGPALRCYAVRRVGCSRCRNAEIIRWFRRPAKKLCRQP